MKEAKFKLGDVVETGWIGIGKVTDVMYSAYKDEYTYEVTNDEDGSDLFSEEELQLIPKKKDFSMDVKIDIAQNVVIVTLYEDCGDTIKKPLRRGHGHIIHDGELGIAQAASYACRRLYESLGGTYTKNER